MSSSERPRGRRRGATILARFLAYETAGWGVLALLAHGILPFAAAAVMLFAVYVTVPLLLFVRWRGWPFYPGALFRLLVVRVALYAQLLLPFVAGAGLLGLLLGWPLGASLAAGRIAAALVLVAALVVLSVGYLGSRMLVVRRVDAFVPRLPAPLAGTRIAQISDLHVGPHTSRAFLAAVARTVDRLTPDIIAVTGDVVDDRSEDVPHYAAAFAGLRAPLGVFCIPGNHDIYAGWPEVEAALAEHTETTVLVNAAHVVEKDGARLAIVGTGDPAAGMRRGPLASGPSAAAPDVARAMAAVPDDALAVAFAHNPALWPSLAERGVALTLSGHTHWGQLALPKLGWSLASPFLEHAMGAHVAGESLLYINPGTGYWGIPFRIGALPEVTLVTLRVAEGVEGAIVVGAAERAATATAADGWRRVDRLVYSASTE